MIPATIQADARAILFAALGGACKPRQALSVSQWADAHRKLSPKASSRPGDWRTSATPFLREPMDCLSERSPVQRLVIIKCTQMGGTEVGLNWIGYVMDHCPAPMLVVVPTIEVRRRWGLQRLEPMLRETPPLKRIMGALKTRDSSNGQDIKDYPGGMLVLGGANSAASLASMPVRYALCDEVDRFKWELAGEGDPLGLIENRLKAFPRRKMALISTPTVKGASRIEEEYEKSDRRRYHVPCPHCTEKLVLQWKNLQWNATVTHVVYVCEHCGAEIEEHHKQAMLAAGVWIAENPDSKTRGYHINALYAPPGLGLTWPELVRDFLDARQDPVKLKRFINTQLGETWEDRSRDVRPNVLAQRAEPFKLREIPPGCLILTCGVDTQDDRLSVQLLGWGANETNWILDWVELPGNPGREELWLKLTQLLVMPLTNSYGKSMRIEATAIDTGGHFTHEVYAYVRSRAAPRLMAVKGASVPGKPVLAGRPVPQDINLRGKVIKNGVSLWTVGSDTAKHALYNRLVGDQGADVGGRRIHFSNELPAEFYDQLVSEVFDPERNKWVRRRGRRNEGLDTWCYGFAAAHHPEIRVHALRPADWSRLARVLEPQPEPVGEAEKKPEVRVEQKHVPQPVKPADRVPPRDGSEVFKL